MSSEAFTSQTPYAGAPAAVEPSARELRSLLPPDRRRRSSVIGLCIVAANCACYVTAFYVTFTASHSSVRVLAAVAAGFVIAFMFIVGHDACHGSFVWSRRANRLIARLCFLPSLQPYSSWFLTHNGHHHGWTNLRGRDPAFAPFNKSEFDTLPRHRRWLERFYRTPFGLGVFYFAEVWWRLELFPAPRHRPKDAIAFALDRLGVAVFAIAQFAVACSLASDSKRDTLMVIVEVMALLGISYAVWFWLAGFVTFQQHTHYRVPWFDSAAEWNYYQGQVHCSPHVMFPTWINRLFHNVMDHAAHHVDPQVPLYRLPTTQEALHQVVGGHLHRVSWSVPEMLRVLRRCRLYDYERHQWLNFDGTPTSESGLQRLSALAAEPGAADGGA